eukprot:scaffold5546_cov247-Pinguiococcus_pyrenoidosus.AAC.3
MVLTHAAIGPWLRRPIAQRIANVTPFFPFKGIERFYDIGGFMRDPEALRLVVEVLTNRYRDQELTSIGCIDARGFVLGPPVALALGLPCFMLRKKGKMPNAITGKAYSKEYAGDDSLSIPRGAVQPGDRVLLIDDLVATGGTLAASVELVHLMGGVVVECACAVELRFLNASKLFEEKGFGQVPIWALMSEVSTSRGRDEASWTPSAVDDVVRCHRKFCSWTVLRIPAFLRRGTSTMEKRTRRAWTACKREPKASR